MAKPKNNADGKAEGFKIPIEDAVEEAAAEEETVEAASDEETSGGAVAEEDAEAAEGEDDIVAEAEAVVEEAAAADELEKALQEASDWQDRYLRLHAEWDTYRRRITEQRAEEKARATEKLVENLLPVLDDFERSIAYATENGESGLLEGVKAVQSKLVGVLEKSGVEVIDPAGEPFDALRHQAIGRKDEPFDALEAQAVATVPDDAEFDETVRDVYQKGYKMGKKVIRAAMVTITTGGPKRPKDEEADDKE